MIHHIRYQRQISNSTLEGYVISGQAPEETTTFINHIIHMETNTLSEQLQLLGSVPNNHWWQYIKCDGEPNTTDVQVNLHDHLLYHPSCDSNDDNLRQRYFPKSP